MRFSELFVLLHKTLPSSSLRLTKSLHASIIRCGLLSDLRVYTNLLLSYFVSHSDSHNNSTTDSLLAFLNPSPTDASPWNPVISSLSRSDSPSFALHVFSFVHRRTLPIDSFALCSALCAATASSLKPVKLCLQLQPLALKSGCLSNVFVTGALIEFYAKRGLLLDARKLFDEMPRSNVVCANSLLAGYVKGRRWEEGLSLFCNFCELGIEPDGITLSAVLRICAEVTTIHFGLQVHAFLIHRVNCWEDDIYLQSSLVELYGRCGLVNKAELIFNLVECTKRDVVLWTSMLNAYGRNGRFEETINLYNHMFAQGIKPDEVTFLAILSACSHSGNVVRGLSYFESMSRSYGLRPGLEHYGCVFDMLCKAGMLEKAWDLANEMVVSKDGNCNTSVGVTVWGSLLSACKECGNINLGESAARKALELDSRNVGIYVELSNMYARFGMWDEIEVLREVMKGRDLKKDMGSSQFP